MASPQLTCRGSVVSKISTHVCRRWSGPDPNRSDREVKPQGRRACASGRRTPVCSQLLILLFAATDFLHRTVQILVTIYMWNCGCLMSLNNIEQSATKTEQQWNHRARQVSFADVSNVWRVYLLKSRHSRSAHTPIRLRRFRHRMCRYSKEYAVIFSRRSFRGKGTTKSSCT
jgi:hypothetical protein